MSKLEIHFERPSHVWTQIKDACRHPRQMGLKQLIYIDWGDPICANFFFIQCYYWRKIW